MEKADNILLVTLFSKFGSYDLIKMCSDLNVSNDAVKSTIKRKSWELFGASLDFYKDKNY